MKADTPIALDKVKGVDHILPTFGSGAMSFGAISRSPEYFLAMREIGGRCNSGEGGENPFTLKKVLVPPLNKSLLGVLELTLVPCLR